VAYSYCVEGIKVEEDVYDMLTKLGSKNETFSDIVKKAVDYYHSEEMNET
jgi:predicted CopG family antitoxin